VNQDPAENKSVSSRINYFITNQNIWTETMKKSNKSTHEIDCPIFSEHEEKMKRLNQFINSRKIISEKVDKAQELVDIINLLSCCPKFDKEEKGCESCRFISNLSKEIARIILKANETAHKTFLV